MRRLLAPLAILALVVGLSAQLIRTAPLAQAAAYNAQRASTLDTYLQRCQALAGLGPDLWYDWDDLGHGGTQLFGWTTVAVGTGAASSNASGFRHIARVTTGGTAASSYQARQNSAGNVFLSDSTTDRWCHFSRWAMVTAVTAQTTAYSGIWREDLAHTLGIGVFGANSTVNFVVQHSPTGVETGTFLSTGKAIDTSYHVFMIWSPGDGKIYAQVDAGTIVSATQTVALVRGAEEMITIRNGTDAVSRTVDVDWTLYVTGRTP